MDEYVIRGSTLTAIADAIRAKKAATSDYIQLEYIESTGTQYIDTGYKFTSNRVRVRAVMELMDDDSGDSIMFGTYNDAASGSEGVYSICMYDPNNYDDGTYATASGGSEGATPGGVVFPLSKNTQYTIQVETFAYSMGFGTGQVSVNGSVSSYTYQGNLDKLYDFYIFTCNKSGEALPYFSKFRLFSFQVYDNNLLVRDFIPCVRADGSVGMYDNVGQKFYENAGGGAFISGARIGPIGGTTGEDYGPIPTTNMAYEILTIGHTSEQLPVSVRLEDTVLVIE